ncbi:MAG TPA: hypothetical protein VFG62_26035 [Rhodopila sp.]|jgi:hypothetical protein|nr:hypothetical protein [Rhodopila sp.]
MIIKRAKRPKDGLTDAERNLLKAVTEGGSAVIQKQRLLCAGEFLPFMPSTALALVGKGRLRFSEPKRLEPVA